MEIGELEKNFTTKTQRTGRQSLEALTWAWSYLCVLCVSVVKFCFEATRMGQPQPRRPHWPQEPPREPLGLSPATID
jgi:hypothetical protein